MNMDELTLGQIKQLQNLFSIAGTSANEIDKKHVGKICMIRTYSAGVHFGTVVSKNLQNVVLHNAHRVHYWKEACSLSQLAMEGSKDIGNSRISMAVTEIELDRCIEVIPLAPGVFQNLTSKLWKK